MRSPTSTSASHSTPSKRRCAEETLLLRNDLAAAHNVKAGALRILHQHVAALPCLDRALELDPDHIQAWTRLLASLIPVVAVSAQDVVAGRRAFETELSALERAPIRRSLRDWASLRARLGPTCLPRHSFEAVRFRSNDAPNRGGRGIPRVRGALGLDEKDVRFLFGHRAMLDSLGDHEYFARPEGDHFLSKLNADAAAENKKEIVGVVMLVPDKFAFHLDYHQVMSVESTDDARLPVLRKGREFLSEIDRFHDRGPANSTSGCLLY
jgi:hypothetical protein